MIERALSKTDIRTLLHRLSERLREKRVFAKIHVVGSACMALAYERERTTLDIDVRVTDSPFRVADLVNDADRANVAAAAAPIAAVDGGSAGLQRDISYFGV